MKGFIDKKKYLDMTHRGNAVVYFTVGYNPDGGILYQLQVGQCCLAKTIVWDIAVMRACVPDGFEVTR